MAHGAVQIILERIVLPVLVLGGIVALALASRSALARSPRFIVDPARVQVRARPGWLDPAAAAALGGELGAALGGPTSLLAGAELDAWSERLAQASPWIESVRSVQTRFPSQLDVQLVLRRPVLDLGGGWLMSPDGVALPGTAEGVVPRPLPCPRAPTDRGAAECAAAAADLAPHRAELRALGVELGAVDLGRDGLVVFTTTGGVRLEWGRSSRSSAFARFDLPAAGRVANLREVLEHHPGLAGLAEVKLWYDRPQVRPGPGAERSGGG